MTTENTHDVLSSPSLPGRSWEQLPGPKALPILGNLLQVDRKKLHLILEQWCDSYGPIYKFSLPNKPIVVVGEPDLIQKILRERPETYRRMSTMTRVVEELGLTGVFSAEGEQWRRQRHLTMQAFNPDHLRRFFPTLLKITERLKRRWDECSLTPQAVDVQKEWQRYTVDVTTGLAFGHDMNTLEEDGDLLQHHLEIMFPAFNRRINAPFPYWHYFKLPSDHALERSLVVIRQRIGEFIRQGRQRLTENPDLASHPTNFLEAMLAAHEEGVAKFTDEEVYGNVLTILLAGEDTAAHTLAWIIYLMTEHPEVQQRMQQEAEAVLGNQVMPQDFNSLGKLRYIEAVAFETLRLRSVAPLLFLEPNVDVDVGGVRIPRGTALMLVTRYGALQEENFTAAGDFQPERWLQSDPADQVHNRGAFVPFGAGPRFCPGRHLALLEIKSAMAMVCRNFNLTRVDTGRPVEEIFSFAMMPKKLLVTFARRRPCP